MKAAVLTGAEVFTIQELPDPKLIEGEVLIRVKACAVCGTDLRIYRYGHPKIKYPALIGHEIVGIVEKRADRGSTPVPEGSWVMVTPGIPCGTCDNCLRGRFCTHKSSIGYQHPGGFAEYLVVPAQGAGTNLFPLPVPLPPDQEAGDYTLAEPLACALNGLEQLGELPFGGSALIVGAGAIGVMLARLLGRRGIEQLAIADISADKLGIASRLLPPQVARIDSRQEDLREQTREITKGRGFDVVVVACSAAEVQEQALQLVALYGRILYFAGLPPGQSSIRFDSNALHYRLASVHGTYGSTLYQNREAMRLIASGLTRGIRDARYPLEKIDTAFPAGPAGHHPEDHYRAMNLLGLDLGTTGIRATLLDQEGQVVVRIQRDYPPHHSWTDTAGPRAEEEASFFYQALIGSVGELLPSARVKASDVGGIGISAMAPDAVAVDADGSTLSPCILWMDRRAAAEARLIRRRIGEQRVLRLSGNPVDPYFGLCKVLWIKRNLPDVYRRAGKIVSLKDLLVGQLTGTYITDVSHAGITGVAFDIRNNRWDEEMLRDLGLDRSKLPDVYPSDHVVGGLSAAAGRQLGLLEGTPVVNGMIDSAAGYLACGAIAPLESAMTLGTSSCWGAAVETALFPQGMNITKTPWRPDLYLVNASLAGGGAAVSWLLGLLGLPNVSASRQDHAELENKAAALPIGSKRLLTLPHFLGERAPLWDADARGLLFGLSPDHRREHLYRSVLEGVAFSLYRNKLLLEDAGIDLRDEVIVTGGSARSALFRRILADALAVTVSYIGDERGGDYGAAWLAGKGVGVFPDYEGLRRNRRVIATSRPDMDNHRLYRKLYGEIYSDLYPRLKRSFRRLAAFSAKSTDSCHPGLEAGREE